MNEKERRCPHCNNPMSDLGGDILFCKLDKYAQSINCRKIRSDKGVKRIKPLISQIKKIIPWG